eukprot:TRINITY_DN711_c0_g3_i1.p2 TRINITY_DN711_c0_g3~~TRINITY_DN711_c0_g3_i1.p2  ORF type:complete len:337 (+),score=131.70 TRINITY_DN711_c0_g3_i1:521-1531(+)
MRCYCTPVSLSVGRAHHTHQPPAGCLQQHSDLISQQTSATARTRHTLLHQNKMSAVQGNGKGRNAKSGKGRHHHHGSPSKGEAEPAAAEVMNGAAPPPALDTTNYVSINEHNAEVDALKQQLHQTKEEKNALAATIQEKAALAEKQAALAAEKAAFAQQQAAEKAELAEKNAALAQEKATLAEAKTAQVEDVKAQMGRQELLLEREQTRARAAEARVQELEAASEAKAVHTSAPLMEVVTQKAESAYHFVSLAANTFPPSAYMLLKASAVSTAVSEQEDVSRAFTTARDIFESKNRSLTAKALTLFVLYVTLNFTLTARLLQFTFHLQKGVEKQDQ